MNFLGCRWLRHYGIRGFSPLFAVLEGEPAMSAIPGVALMFLGTTLELIADNQLYAFHEKTVTYRAFGSWYLGHCPPRTI